MQVAYLPTGCKAELCRAYFNVPTGTDVFGDLKSVLEDSSKHVWKICIIGQQTMIF